MVGVSSIPGAGDGVWTTKTIKKDTLFGPYEGVFRKKTEDGSTNYSWEIKKERKPIGFVDAQDIATSNWMRFVNCARSTYEQNLVAHQYKGKIYYRAFDDIPSNRELFVYYGSQFAEEQLGIENFKENKDLPHI
nr:PREDICTED: probable histone-lysine N-methyltransferase PRDM7 [Bemisia tabaci]